MNKQVNILRENVVLLQQLKMKYIHVPIESGAIGYINLYSSMSFIIYKCGEIFIDGDN